MPATTLIITAFLAQSAFSLAADDQRYEQADVGFEELAQGEPVSAIEKIEANKRLDSDDPAALINLGNAHAQLGMTEKAMEYYRAAMASQEHYNLELADGRWMDSRRAARKALNGLLKANAQASR